jgi:predicted dehydrogenase
VNPDKLRYPARVALVGTGAWGRVLTRSVSSSSKIRVTCCVGRNPERQAAFVRATGVPAARSYANVLSDPNIDGVLLALPNEMHLTFAQSAAQAGKHVYIEKPIANSLEDGLRVAALGDSYGVYVAVGHCARFLAGIRQIRSMIDAGRLGQVNLIEAWFSNDRGLRLTPEDWRWYRERSPGGCLSQIAIHQFDTLRYLGGDLRTIGAVCAHRSPLSAEVEDQWVVAVTFADGKLGALTSSWTSPGTFGVRVSGDLASASYEIDQAYWSEPQELHRGAQLHVQERGKGIAAREIIVVPPGDMFRDELEHFAESIIEHRPIDISGDNGVQALAAVYAALASASRDGLSQSIAGAIATAESRMRGERKSPIAKAH